VLPGTELSSGGHVIRLMKGLFCKHQLTQCWFWKFLLLCTQGIVLATVAFLDGQHNALRRQRGLTRVCWRLQNSLFCGNFSIPHMVMAVTRSPKRGPHLTCDAWLSHLLISKLAMLHVRFLHTSLLYVLETRWLRWLFCMQYNWCKTMIILLAQFSILMRYPAISLCTWLCCKGSMKSGTAEPLFLSLEANLVPWCIYLELKLTNIEF
jgi:hypothetical protein